MCTAPYWRLVGLKAAMIMMVSAFKCVVVNSGNISCKAVEKALRTMREVQIISGWRNQRKLSGRGGI